MATLKDIAHKLGISPSTVSKGLNGAHDISEELRQQVLDTAIELESKFDFEALIEEAIQNIEHIVVKADEGYKVIKSDTDDLF